MFALVRKIFGHRAPPHAAKARPARAQAAEAHAPAPAEEATLDAYLRALKLELPRPAERTAEESARLERMAAAIGARLESDPSGPEAFPAQCAQVLRLVSDPSVGLAELSRVVGQDAALSAAVLRVANSAFYRARGASQTLRDATARLGAQEVARLAGIVSVQVLFHPKLRSVATALAGALATQHKNAVATSLAAGWLALRKRGARSDLAALGGLLCDVGSTMALRAAADLAASGHADVKLDDPLLPEAIEQLHANAGAEMARAWSLPDFVHRICLHHHEPAVVTLPENVELHVVRVVAALRELRADAALHRSSADVLVDSARALGIGPGEMRAVDAEIQRLCSRAALLVAA